MGVCPSCGHGHQVGAKFCSECGAALVKAEPRAQEERKVVTVLFADLVGFTSQAEQMVRAALRIYENQRAEPLAEQARAALASLTGQPRSEPA